MNKKRYITYRVYCEDKKNNEKYNYMTSYLYVGQEDLSAYRIEKIDRKGNETIIYEKENPND